MDIVQKLGNRLRRCRKQIHLDTDNLFVNIGRSSLMTEISQAETSCHHVHSTPCLKNVPPLACYNFDTHEWILTFFGRNVTDKVGNQKRFAMPPQITCASALPGKTGKHENHIFHSIGLCYTHNAPVHCFLERKNCHL